MSSKRKLNGGEDEDNNGTKKRVKIDTGVSASVPARVTPSEGVDEASQTPAKGKPHTVSELFQKYGRTPPKGSENMPLNDDLMTGRLARELLGCTFDECENVEKQLRYTFIVMKDYKTILETQLFALGSPYAVVLKDAGYKSTMDALKKSLEKETPCGIRLGRMIRKGGDVTTEICNREELDECIQTYDEFLTQNVAWKDSETSVFRQTDGGSDRVDPFLRLQSEASDLCYMLQASNCLDYVMQKRALEGASIEPKRLNNAKFIRNHYTNEQSCKHIYAGKGHASDEMLRDILEICNPGVARDQVLFPLPLKKFKHESDGEAAARLYSEVGARLKGYGPGILDMPMFEEFKSKGAAKHAGDFSTKTRTTGKHTILLVDVRKSEDEEEPDGGGYFALFQNTWSNRQIWVELGFDLLLSMGVCCHFINNELKFDKEIDAADARESILAQNSSRPPLPAATFTRYSNDRTLEETHLHSGEEEEEVEEDAVEPTNENAGSAGKAEAKAGFSLPDAFETYENKRGTVYQWE